jgi:hypothetical protein
MGAFLPVVFVIHARGKVVVVYRVAAMDGGARGNVDAAYWRLEVAGSNANPASARFAVEVLDELLHRLPPLSAPKADLGIIRLPEIWRPLSPALLRRFCAHGEADQLDDVARAELGHDARLVDFHGARADAQLLADFLGMEPSGPFGLFAAALAPTAVALGCLWGLGGNITELFDLGLWARWFGSLDRGFLFLLILPFVVAAVGLWAEFMRDKN